MQEISTNKRTILYDNPLWEISTKRSIMSQPFSNARFFDIDIFDPIFKRYKLNFNENPNSIRKYKWLRDSQYFLLQHIYLGSEVIDCEITLLAGQKECSHVILPQTKKWVYSEILFPNNHTDLYEFVYDNLEGSMSLELIGTKPFFCKIQGIEYKSIS